MYDSPIRFLHFLPVNEIRKVYWAVNYGGKSTYLKAMF